MIQSRTIALAACLCILAAAPYTFAQQNATLNSLHEIVLTSGRDYTEPQWGVELTCTFSSPTGAMHTVAGFWNGGREYRIRFSPDETGVWTYETTCNDEENTGLHAQQGAVEVAAYTGTNPFFQHGGIETSANGQYFQHADGTPYFYLGDTAWEIMWKSKPADAADYLADRAAKGFTAIQTVLLSHQRLGTNGVANYLYEPAFLNQQYTLPNKRYFEYVDTLVASMNESGMAAMIVPLWAAFTEVHDDGSAQLRFNREQAMQWARYVGARYGGYKVIWMIGGDNEYDTEEKREFWNVFAQSLETASGGRHLMSIHPSGGNSTLEYFDQQTTWIDYNTYQSSHTVNNFYTYLLALQAFIRTPPKPVLNSEPCYEDIYAHLWEPGDTTHPGTQRIQPVHVRFAAYSSILAGSKCGTAYGANGVWQWNTRERPGSHYAQFFVREAWQMPGSTHMGILRKIMEQYRWYELTPRPDLIKERESRDYLAVAKSGDFLLAYFPQGATSLTLTNDFSSNDLVYYWIDPITGDSTQTATPSLQPAENTVTVSRVDTSDALLIIRTPIAPPNAIDDVPAAEGFSVTAAPNPFTAQTALHFDRHTTTSDITIALYDTYGRKVQEYRVERGQSSLTLAVPAKGVYFYRAISDQGAKGQTLRTGKLISR